MTIEDVYTKLVELTEICEREFKRLEAGTSVTYAALAKIDKRISNQDAKLDAFIEDVIEMKREMKQ